MIKLLGKNVMITGGAGFIGSHLVERIIQESPNKIVVVDNLFLGLEKNLEDAKKHFPSLKFKHQDTSMYEPMLNIIEGEQIEVIFNLAVLPLPLSLKDPRFVVDINVKMVNVLCDLLRKDYYRTLIHFSSSEAYGSAKITPMNENHPICPETPYAASKVAGDYVITSYINTFNIDASIIRPFNNYGPRQNKGSYAGIIPIVINNAMKEEDIIIFGDGNQTRDFVYVKDTVDAAVKIYENTKTRRKIINIASGFETNINKLVRKILSLMNCNTKIIYDRVRPGDVRKHCGDISLAKELIDFNPSIISDDHLLETINWYKIKQ